MPCMAAQTSPQETLRNIRSKPIEWPLGLSKDSLDFMHLTLVRGAPIAAGTCIPHVLFHTRLLRHHPYCTMTRKFLTAVPAP